MHITRIMFDFILRNFLRIQKNSQSSNYHSYSRDSRWNSRGRKYILMPSAVETGAIYRDKGSSRDVFPCIDRIGEWTKRRTKEREEKSCEKEKKKDKRASVSTSLALTLQLFNLSARLRWQISFQISSRIEDNGFLWRIFTLLLPSRWSFLEKVTWAIFTIYDLFCDFSSWYHVVVCDIQRFANRTARYKYVQRYAAVINYMY